MQFLIIAKDGKDPDALNRRLEARAKHIHQSDEAIKRGEQIIGAAILDKNKEMSGSVMIVEFETREKLDEWLRKEPYVTENVWQDIEILECKIGPSFEKLLEDKKS